MVKTDLKMAFDILNKLPIGVFVIDESYHVVFWNSIMKEWTSIDSSDVINRDIREIYENFNSSNIDLRLKQIFGGGAPVVFSAYFHKYIVPIKVRDDLRVQHTTVVPVLNDSDGSYYAMFSIQDVTDLSLKIKELKIKSVTDPLTSIYNRGYFFEFARQKLEHAKRCGGNLSIAILDIDFFKKINDTYGHYTGDLVLKHFTEMIKKSLRSYDILARYGGEEFIIMFVDCDKIIATNILNRIKGYLLENEFHHNGQKILYTFSGGVVELLEIDKITQDTFDKLIKISDDRLYISKNSGRNKITNS
jgi:diguanylate cyclase (GGDEF)-like protein